MLTHTDNLVLLTGSTDYLSDGERVLAIENGHELLGQVTGVRPTDPPIHSRTNENLDRLCCWHRCRLLPDYPSVR